MSNYIDQSNIINRVSEKTLIFWTDDTGSGAVNPATVTAFITKAEGIVDSYLSEKVSIPVLSPTDIIKVWAEDIAIYLLKSRKREIDKEDPVLKDYVRTLGQLQKVASGSMSVKLSTIAITRNRSMVLTSETREMDWGHETDQEES